MKTAAVVALVATALCGCRPLAVHPDDPPPVRIQPKWQLQLSTPPVLAWLPEETAQPAYGHDGKIVVAGSEAGEVVAAWSNSGRVLWRFKTEGKIRGAPAIVGNAVYVGSTDGRLYRLDLKSGTLAWDKAYETVGAITSAPAVSGRRVIFQNNENRTYALDSATGEYVWDQGRPRPESFTIKGEGGPTIGGDTVFAGYEDGFLAALNLQDGATLWTRSLAADARQFVDVDTRPVVSRGVVYAGCFAVGLYALGAKNGEVRWLHRGRGIVSPALGGDTLYVATGDREVHALDPETGALRWKLALGYGVLGPPVARSGHVWISTGDALLRLDESDGNAVARLSPSDGQSAPVAARGSWIHFVTNSGALVGAQVY